MFCHGLHLIVTIGTFYLLCIFISCVSLSSKDLRKDELNEIAQAMEMTDEDMFSEMNDLPNFSLGFDFLDNAGEETDKTVVPERSVEQKPALGRQRHKSEVTTTVKTFNFRATECVQASNYSKTLSTISATNQEASPLNFSKPVTTNKLVKHPREKVRSGCETVQRGKPQSTFTKLLPTASGAANFGQGKPGSVQQETASRSALRPVQENRMHFLKPGTAVQDGPGTSARPLASPLLIVSR